MSSPPASSTPPSRWGVCRGVRGGGRSAGQAVQGLWHRQRRQGSGGERGGAVLRARVAQPHPRLPSGGGHSARMLAHLANCRCPPCPAPPTPPRPQVGVSVPLIVRLEGTNVERGKEILSASGLDLITASDLDDAAHKVGGMRGGLELELEAVPDRRVCACASGCGSARMPSGLHCARRLIDQAGCVGPCFLHCRRCSRSCRSATTRRSGRAEAFPQQSAAPHGLKSRPCQRVNLG